MAAWHEGLRGGRCYFCGVAWAWKASAVAPLTGATCRQCGGRLQQTALASIKRIPIRAGFPWYRTDLAPPGVGTRYQLDLAKLRARYVMTVGREPRKLLEMVHESRGHWFTFDPGPGSDTRQAGRRLVRQWAPADVAAPPWLQVVEDPNSTAPEVA